MEPAPRCQAGHRLVRRHGSGRCRPSIRHDGVSGSEPSFAALVKLVVVQVWDVLQEAPVSNYQGHTGYLLSVDWSPVDPDVIWTGGKDFTVQEWRVSKQEFTKPPKGEAQPTWLRLLLLPPRNCRYFQVRKVSS